MSLQIDIQRACSEPAPDEDDIRSWLSAVLDRERPGQDSELCLRLVDETEMTALNSTWRGKAGPTNVLSFPADLPPELALPLLGDIVICSPVVAREAAAQGKPARAHWAHLLVHGCLHLLGHDHIDPEEARAMEALETRLLATLGFPCPYEEEPVTP
ncbi:rRNA maturation RNAse YbeY [Haliea atlantica]|jgi:probable rRNA maturation factor|nr:rRNA maturation RNase YbeY [Haliea sp.]|tara:strand:+ start:33252 stop:33722 length:471 start_codon:yes stop_codon:yes gene_type:complete